jgi:hypothetical protein
MSALPTPKVVDLDDPLAPRRALAPAPQEPDPSPAPGEPPVSPKRQRPRRPPARADRAPAPPLPAPSLADEQLVAVFARMPESLSDRLAEGVRALNAGRPRRGRVTQQDLLGALVERYVTPDVPEPLGELVELVDGYRQRIRR